MKKRQPTQAKAMGVPDCQLELWLLRAQNGYMYESDEKFMDMITSDLRQRIAGQGHKMAGKPKLVAGPVKS